MTAALAILRAIGRWLRDHPVAALAVVGAAALAWYRRRAQRAEGQRDVAVRARVRAEDTAAVTTEALERRDAGARTREDVIDAARREAETHPTDADAAARGAREYARRRFDVVRADDADRGANDPVHRDAAADAASRGRGH